MNCKAKGNRNERRSMELLEATGYRCCRSAASLGARDIIGVGGTDHLEQRISELERKQNAGFENPR